MNLRKFFVGRAIVFAIILVLVAIGYFVLPKKTQNIPPNQYEEGGIGTYTENGAIFERVRNQDLGISFAYRKEPAGYVLSEPEPLEAEVVKIYLLMNAKDVADLEASEGVPREGPPSITIKIYDNPTRLPPREWALLHERDTNATRETEYADHMVGGAKAVSFKTDGLYQNSNIVADNNGKIYLFAHQYNALTDRIVGDFADLLNTLVLF